MTSSLILASASPRRRDLLSALGLHFLCVPAHVDESARAEEPPEALVRRLSLAKAQAILQAFPQAAVLGADTIVALDGAVLGKPATPAEAVSMLKALRGRAHEVLSAVSLCQGDDPPRQRLSRSQVWMRAYSDQDILEYVASGDPMDKAGAYAIQHAGFHPAARWEGCYAGVVGFPLRDVAALLTSAGWPAFTQVGAICRGITGAVCCGGA